MRKGRTSAVEIVLRATVEADDDITVSTTLHVDLDDPHWPQWLADAVADQAREGAWRLRDEMLAQVLPTARLPFVPLAALIDAAARR